MLNTKNITKEQHERYLSYILISYNLSYKLYSTKHKLHTQFKSCVVNDTMSGKC